ncbi:DnaJ C-terminal domain-containing protein [Granulosicoccus sp. 3-233]|uniref:DnaJ C-terminal domain-containing protein n=1 Tax=Granulosicoccus sp. 3-233 TaxID=3417969 RepID=UPI003D325095
MEFVDYYNIMGLEDDASADDIKRAYRKLARKYHPDVSKEADSEVRFKELGEAYNVLKDPERRREYDELKQYQGAGGAGFQPPPDWHARESINPEDFSGVGGADYSDFFEQIFGSRFRQQSGGHSEQHFDARGQDIHSNLSVSIHDAYKGAMVELSLSTPVVQNDGNIRTEQKKLKVKVPAGVTNGQKIRLRGQGGPGIGNEAAGDLYIEIRIQEDSRFHLDGKDVSVSVPVMPWEAALGASIEVPTLNGKVRVTVPANASQGQRLRLKGRGLPGKVPGDQYVILSVIVPKAVTEEQKQAYQAMSELWSLDPRTDDGGNS